MNDEYDENTWWLKDAGPVKPSLSSRQICLRGHSNFRGELVYDGRAIQYESLLEFHAIQVLLADRRVLRLEEQPPAISYIGADERTHTHTFDVRVRLVGDARIAILVKPRRRAERPEFVDLVGRLKTALPADFADDLIVVTEAHLPPARTADASLILAARTVVDPHADALVLRAIGQITGPITIGNLRDGLGLGGRGFTAIIRAIDRGALIVANRYAKRPLNPWQLRGDGRIDAYTLVSAASEGWK